MHAQMYSKQGTGAKIDVGFGFIHMCNERLKLGWSQSLWLNRSINYVESAIVKKTNYQPFCVLFSTVLFVSSS